VCKKLIKNSKPFGKKCQKTVGGDVFWLTVYTYKFLLRHHSLELLVYLELCSFRIESNTEVTIRFYLKFQIFVQHYLWVSDSLFCLSLIYCNHQNNYTQMHAQSMNAIFSCRILTISMNLMNPRGSFKTSVFAINAACNNKKTFHAVHFASILQNTFSSDNVKTFK